MVKAYTLFLTRAAQTLYTYLYSLYKGVPLGGGFDALYMLRPEPTIQNSFLLKPHIIFELVKKLKIKIQIGSEFYGES